jgi:DNA replication protein DnaC
MNYKTPTDWKSEIWWRKRSADERKFHLHLPKRVATDLLSYPSLTTINPSWDTPPSTLIQGPSGSGKSVRAASMLTSYMDSFELSGRWTEADDYIEMLKDSFDNDGLLPSMYSTPYLVKYIKGGFDILVLDGLGEERLTEFAAHELGSLIRKRHDRMRCTIITSRLSLGDIKNRYGERLGTVLAEFDVESMGGRRGR